jgi:5'-phosphate synthase pdxT subunit
MRVGVLALQGGFEPHVAMLARIGVRAEQVRRPEQIEELSHLVLPGGESTTLHRLLELFGMGERIARRYRDGQLVLFGTCAGAILLGRGDGSRPPRMELLDARLVRNAYGTQLDSRIARTEVLGRTMDCTLIRAPRITAFGAAVRVLATLDGDPILVEQDELLAATFHPELSDDSRIHERFLAIEPRSSSSAIDTSSLQVVTTLLSAAAGRKSPRSASSAHSRLDA